MRRGGGRGGVEGSRLVSVILFSALFLSCPMDAIDRDFWCSSPPLIFDTYTDIAKHPAALWFKYGMLRELFYSPPPVLTLSQLNSG
jgi:hypothetical protein